MWSRPINRCCLVANMCAASKVNYIYHVWPLGAASNTACPLFEWANTFTAMVFPGCQGNGPWKLIHQLLQALAPPSPPSPSPSPPSLLLCAPCFKWYHFGVHRSFTPWAKLKQPESYWHSKAESKKKEERIGKHIRREKLKQNTMKSWSADYALPQTDPVCGAAYKSL